MVTRPDGEKSDSFAAALDRLDAAAREFARVNIYTIPFGILGGTLMLVMSAVMVFSHPLWHQDLGTAIADGLMALSFVVFGVLFLKTGISDIIKLYKAAKSSVWPRQ